MFRFEDETPREHVANALTMLAELRMHYTVEESDLESVTERIDKIAERMRKALAKLDTPTALAAGERVP